MGVSAIHFKGGDGDACIKGEIVFPFKTDV